MNWNMADMVGKPMTYIVERLRGQGCSICMAERREAADEIVALRDENARYKFQAQADCQEIRQLHAEIERLREALKEIAQLTRVSTKDANEMVLIARTALKGD